MGAGGIIWETTDRLGRQVVLTDQGWEHILFQHENMANLRDRIRDAVAFADEIVRDRDYAHREIHHRKRDSSLSWIRVIVHYRPRESSDWIGEVITAHVTSRRDPREAPQWPSKYPH